MKHLLSKAIHKNNRAVVYLLKVEDSKNSCFKVGYTTNIAQRLEYMPDRLKVDVLDVFRGSRQDMKEFERFIHTNSGNKYSWIGRKWNGYTELYTKRIDLTQWHMLFTKHKLRTTGEIQLDDYIQA